MPYGIFSEIHVINLSVKIWGYCILGSVADPNPGLFGHPDPDPQREKHRKKSLENYT